MSTARRTKPIVSKAGALQPESSDGLGTSPLLEAREEAARARGLYEEALRHLAHERSKLIERNRIISNERKRHSSIEALTLRLVAQLEERIADLRTLYFQNLTIPTAPLEKK
jgi:hypothetical protein